LPHTLEHLIFLGSMGRFEILMGSNQILQDCPKPGSWFPSKYLKIIP
jgi:hypothetical protein